MRTEHIEEVTLAGFRQLEETTAYYGLAGAFVHPAQVDQWGLVVNEAMAAGLPVLVSKRAGCAHDLIRDGENGFCFDPADASQLSRLLCKIASPDTDRAAMGRRSREIIARWSPDRFAEGLWQALQTGQQQPRRPFSLPLRLLLWLLRKATRDIRSFHAIKD